MSAQSNAEPLTASGDFLASATLLFSPRKISGILCRNMEVEMIVFRLVQKFGIGPHCHVDRSEGIAEQCLHAAETTSSSRITERLPATHIQPRITRKTYSLQRLPAKRIPATQIRIASPAPPTRQVLQGELGVLSFVLFQRPSRCASQFSASSSASLRSLRIPVDMTFMLAIRNHSNMYSVFVAPFGRNSSGY